MSCIVNTSFNSSSTPVRKRKRVSEGGCAATAAADGTKDLTPTTAVVCFTNAAFSSTPKKLVGRRRKLISSGSSSSHSEKTNPFLLHSCLEVKSIADIVLQTQLAKQQLDAGVTQHASASEQLPTNPYEVQRKPPKKKKRDAEEAACFENAALNLELPEQQFNPYEVHRQPLPIPLPQAKGHINAALNLRGQDVPASRNPFEIPRCSAVSLLAANPEGVENLGMTEAVSTNLKIGLPFMPTMGCRIDFKNMALAQLTPSKLLAEKLVFSPVPGPKRSLGAISEESSMDIGRELDRYQLELENSINEAKLRKNVCGGGDLVEATHTATVVSMHMEPDLKVTFTQKLAEITEREEEEVECEDENVQEILEVKDILNSENQKTETVINHETFLVFDNKENNLPKEVQVETAPVGDNLNAADSSIPGEDVAYASDSDEDNELDFKAPAPFVRAYRRAASPKLTVSKESLNSIKSDKSVESLEQKKSNVKSLIRKSIRKLMHPTHNINANKEDAGDKSSEKPEKHTTNIIASIRQSLRRKPSHKHLVEEPHEAESAIAAIELSIIDNGELRLKLKAPASETNDVNNERKHSLRHSLRQSTRELRQQVMKSVFHKNHEEYDFSK